LGAKDLKKRVMFSRGVEGEKQRRKELPQDEGRGQKHLEGSHRPFK